MTSFLGSAPAARWELAPYTNQGVKLAQNSAHGGGRLRQQSLHT